MTDDEQTEFPKIRAVDDLSDADKMPEGATEAPKPGPGEEIIAEVTVQFDSTGSMGAKFANMKPNLLWAAGRFLDTLGTRMWNENRDAEIAQAMAQQAEVERVAGMLRGHLPPRRRQ